MKTSRALMLSGATGVLIWAGITSAVDPGIKCQVSKLKESGKYVR
jgi:hypothetical protein